MTTAPAKKNIGTMAVVGVLGAILLVGAVMFAYFGFQLLRPKPADGEAPPKGTAVAQGTDSTPTVARTGVVIIASTAIPGTAGTAPTATPDPVGTEASPTPTRTPVKRSTAVASGGSDSDKLPQTGLGLGTPVFGLLLAGLAFSARRLRRQP